MAGFRVGVIMFLFFAIVGLILLGTGIFFVVKNVKWKSEKDKQGISTTSNIIGIVIFSFMIFFGAIWFFGFGIGAVVFGLLGGSF